MKIFIGSSTKSKSKEAAKLLAAHLGTDHKFDVVRSTDKGVYPPGHVKFDSMIKTGVGLQGAIIILSDEDTIEDRENLFIQYAILVGMLQSWRAILCCYGDVKVASDLAGIKHVEFAIGDNASAELEIDAWVKELRNQAPELGKTPLTSEEMSILKLMRRRKGTHGYTTYSFVRTYLLDVMGGDWSPEPIIEKLKSSNLITEENIHGERTYFITEQGVQEAKTSNISGTNTQVTELMVVGDSITRTDTST